MKDFYRNVTALISAEDFEARQAYQIFRHEVLGGQLQSHLKTSRITPHSFPVSRSKGGRHFQHGFVVFRYGVETAFTAKNFKIIILLRL